MNLVGTVTTLSERWLRDRTFELVVAPAIADLQFDEQATGLRRARNTAAVAMAFVWGLYEDVTSDPGSFGTFALLAAIPACYYTMLVAICAPIRGNPFQFPVSRWGALAAIGLAAFVLSLGPVIACYWPERRPRRMPTDTL
jgi:hypothetical protein